MNESEWSRLNVKIGRLNLELNRPSQEFVSALANQANPVATTKKNLQENISEEHFERDGVKLN